MKRISSIICLLIPLSLWSQVNDSWIFGYGAGMRFLQEEVVGFELPAFNQLEGSAVICDENGNPLIISDGMDIYRSDGSMIADKFELGGGQSSTNSAVILPRPGQSDQWYVISVNDLSHPIDKTASGIGYVIVSREGVENQDSSYSLLKNTELISQVGEKLAMAAHGNGRDYWLIARAETNYLVFIVDSVGIHLEHSFNSSIPLSRDPQNPDMLYDVGQMKISLDGTKLAANINKKDIARHSSYLEIFDFDPCTGELSQARQIEDDGYRKWSYGLEWSPENKFVYRSFMDNVSKMYYLIRNSVTELSLIDTLYNSPFPIAGIQSGPDSNLYVICTIKDILGSISRVENADKEEIKDVTFHEAVVEYTEAIPMLSFPCQVPLHEHLEDKFTLGEDTIASLTDYPMTLTAHTDRSNLVTWEDGSTGHERNIDGPGIYSASVTCSCITLHDTIKVLQLDSRSSTPSADENCPVQFPLAFTPNGDGRNDDFGAIYNMDCIANISEYRLRIYSRSGSLVFETKDPSERWSGMETVNQEVFQYTASWLDEVSGRAVEMGGDVTVVW